ncbi:MAG TPA: T9SS type A sorting domain-containing protein, partial [Bacteroides sp.]|nr:T9SS type A sorting domain-containing protein [Bacteroides sp.]
EIADLDADTEQYTDNTIVEYGVYTYRLKAYNSEMETCFTEGLEVEVADPDPPRYQVTVELEGSGRVVMNPDQEDYMTGTEVVLLAVADEGWEFGGWSGDATGTDNPLTLQVDADKVITATFQKISGIYDEQGKNFNVELSPVPFTRELILTSNLEEATEMGVTLYDLNGKKIKELLNEDMPAGKMQISINGADLGKGAYILQIQTTGRIQNRLIMKQ